MVNVSLASPFRDQAAVVQVRGMDPDWDELLVSMPWEQRFAGLVLGGKRLTTPLAIPRPGPAPPVVASSSGATKVVEISRSGAGRQGMTAPMAMPS